MPVAIPVKRLAAHCNPFRGDPWGKAVTKGQVYKALRKGRLIPAPGTDDHAGRIAYFVAHPSTDPIEVDVGAPDLGCWVGWLVQDGNHRLAAAIYARRSTILASVGGQLDYAKELFGVDCDEPSSG